MTQHERAGRGRSDPARDRLYRWLPDHKTASGYGHLTRSRPQDSAVSSQVVGRQKKAPPERGAGAALGAVLLGPHKASFVPPAIHAAQHERAGHAVVRARGRLYRWLGFE